MVDPGVDFFQMALAKLRSVDTRLKYLEDRISVIETCTQDYQSRLEELETWQDKVDDKLEAS